MKIFRDRRHDGAAVMVLVAIVCAAGAQAQSPPPAPLGAFQSGQSCRQPTCIEAHLRHSPQHCYGGYAQAGNTSWCLPP